MRKWLFLLLFISAQQSSAVPTREQVIVVIEAIKAMQAGQSDQSEQSPEEERSLLRCSPFTLAAWLKFAAIYLARASL